MLQRGREYLRKSLVAWKKVAAILLLVAVVTVAILANFDTIGAPLFLNGVSFPAKSSFSGSRQVILGIWAMTPGSHPHGLIRFENSLRKSGSHAHFVVFVPLNEKVLIDSAMSRHALNASLFTSIEFAGGLSYKWKLFSFSSLRFTLARAFLETFGNSFDLVMTSDLSDVVFVEDPFVAIPQFVKKVPLPSGAYPPFIAAALEVLRIRAAELNGYWVQMCFGKSVGAALEGAIVSCSGTTLGDTNSMQQYVTEMDKVMRSSPWCSAQGTDQGVHNVVLRQGKLKDVTIFMPLDSGPVLTVNEVRSFQFEKGTGRPLSPAGNVYAVAHQINRCPDFLEHTWEVTQRDDEMIMSNKTLFGCKTLLNPPESWWAPG